MKKESIQLISKDINRIPAHFISDKYKKVIASYSSGGAT